MDWSPRATPIPANLLTKACAKTVAIPRFKDDCLNNQAPQGHSTSMEFKPMHLIKISLLIFFLIPIFGSTQAVAKKKNWKVSGSVTIAPCHLEALKEAFGSKIPLAGAEVRIQAKIKGMPIFGTWLKKSLPKSGKFSITKKKNLSKRTFRVQLKYNSSKLVVVKGWAGLVPGWHTIYESKPRSNGLTKHINMTESSQGGCASERMRRGEIWIAATKMINYFASLKKAFKKKVKIRYPANNPVVNDNIEAPFANPAGHWITIIKNPARDWLTIDTIWHEMTHIWAYQHSRGELGLVGELLKDKSTHDFQEKPFVAFHEGFAQYTALHLQTVLLNKNRQKPYARQGFETHSGGALNTPKKVMRNDSGWRSILLMLSMEDIEDYNFNASTRFVQKLTTARSKVCPGKRKLSFRQILGTFKKHKSKGFKKTIHTKDMTFRGFFRRAAKIYSSLSKKEESHFRKLINAKSVKQPHQLFCKQLTIRTGVPLKSKP